MGDYVAVQQTVVVNNRPQTSCLAWGCLIVLVGFGWSVCSTMPDLADPAGTGEDGGVDASQPEPEAEAERVEQEAQSVFAEEVYPVLLAAAKAVQSELAAYVESVEVVRNADGTVAVVFTMDEAFQLTVGYDSRHEYAIQLRDWMRAIGDTPFDLVVMSWPQDKTRNAWATWDEKHPRR